MKSLRRDGYRISLDTVKEAVLMTEQAIYGSRDNWVVDESQIWYVCDQFERKATSVLGAEELLFDELPWKGVAILGALIETSGEDGATAEALCMEAYDSYQN